MSHHTKRPGGDAGCWIKGKGPHPGGGGRHQTCLFPDWDPAIWAEGGLDTHVRLWRVWSGWADLDWREGQSSIGCTAQRSILGTLAQKPVTVLPMPPLTRRVAEAHSYSNPIAMGVRSH